MKYKMTAAEREQRRISRLFDRHAAAAKLEAFREWRRERAAAAEERAEVRRKSAQLAKGLRRARKHYVIRGLAPTVEPYTRGKRKGAAEISSELGTSVVNGRKITGTHAERRAAGARGHRRRPRRREMPGAVMRRIERNQKDWSA